MHDVRCLSCISSKNIIELIGSVVETTFMFPVPSLLFGQQTVMLCYQAARAFHDVASIHNVHA